MKFFLIVTNVMLLCIIAFIACDNKPKTTSDVKNGKCDDRMCKNYKDIELKGLIDGELIHTLSKSYSGDPGKSRINGEEKTDALSVSFDLEKIKNLIWHMEDALCRAGCDSRKELGIRFYYIKYPKEMGTAKTPESLRELPAEVANKHSLVMVPVYKSGADWYDFDFENVKPGCKFDRIAVSLNKFKVAGLISMGDNHGGVAPPPDPGIYPTNPPE